MSEDIKACPFCGSLDNWPMSDVELYWRECICGASSAIAETSEGADEAWNQRSPEDVDEDLYILANAALSILTEAGNRIALVRANGHGPTGPELRPKLWAALDAFYAARIDIRRTPNSGSTTNPKRISSSLVDSPEAGEGE